VVHRTVPHRALLHFTVLCCTTEVGICCLVVISTILLYCTQHFKCHFLLSTALSTFHHHTLSHSSYTHLSPLAACFSLWYPPTPHLSPHPSRLLLSFFLPFFLPFSLTFFLSSFLSFFLPFFFSSFLSNFRCND
jgi:hypothetical protein